MLTDTVIHTIYNHGLINLTTVNHVHIVCKKLLIATGTKPKTYNGLFGLPVNYYLDDVKHDDESILIIGNNAGAFKLASKASGQYKTVYIINDDQADYEASYQKHPKNVVPLSFTNINSFRKDKNDIIINLDTYDSIKVTNIIAAVGRVPDTARFLNNLVTIDQGGYIKRANVPNVYACGGVIRDYMSDADKSDLINRILN